MVCAETLVWIETTSNAAGCFYNGQFYSVGSPKVEGFSANPLTYECSLDGTWQEVD